MTMSTVNIAALKDHIETLEEPDPDTDETLGVPFGDSATQVSRDGPDRTLDETSAWSTRATFETRKRPCTSRADSGTCAGLGRDHDGTPSGPVVSASSGPGLDPPLQGGDHGVPNRCPRSGPRSAPGILERSDKVYGAYTSGCSAAGKLVVSHG